MDGIIILSAHPTMLEQVLHWLVFVLVIAGSTKYVFWRRRHKALFRTKHPYRGPHLYWSQRLGGGFRIGVRIK
ncbi:hypothetical protein ACGY1D_13550 [Burkholderia pseudomallei]